MRLLAALAAASVIALVGCGEEERAERERSRHASADAALEDAVPLGEPTDPYGLRSQETDSLWPPPFPAADAAAPATASPPTEPPYPHAPGPETDADWLAALPAADRGERKDLHVAASQGDLAAVRYFVELKYADVDARLGDANEAPMHWAARHGHLDVVRYLVTRGADVDIVNKNGQPPLSYALGKRHAGVAEFLMARGADLELRGLFGGMLHSAAGGSNLEAARYLLSLGFDVNEPAQEYDIRPLCSAGYSGTPEMIGFLIEQGAEVQRACGRAGRTALHRAADGSNVAGARVLLEHGHDPNGRPGESRTPLHMAVEKGNQEFVKLLLEYDVDTDRKDWDERTALEIARKRQRDEIVLLLQGA